MYYGADTVAKLGDCRSRGRVGKRAGVIDNLGLSRGGKLAAAKQGIKGVHKAGKASVRGVAGSHVREHINGNRAAAAIVASDAISVVIVHQDSALEEIHLPGDGSVRGQLEFRCGEAGCSEDARVLIIREKEIKYGR